MTAVVVPIFNAPQETKACLESLAQKTDPTVDVILINDASDHPAIASILANRPAAWTLIENEHNIGFVASANLGMAMAAPNDVVLLNADTEVTFGWLEALEHCLASDPSIASVSPLTNHGEIASIPEFCAPNPYPKDPESWARACYQSIEDPSRVEWIDVPTTIGFCMLLRRETLHAIGCFDEASFGRGYGEENDWCQRAIQAGWRHVLCDRAFVAHQGGASFGPLGLSPGGEAMARLVERYPNYPKDVADFIANDPMANRRRAIVEYYQKTAHNKAL